MGLLDGPDYLEYSPLFPNPLICLRDMISVAPSEVRATLRRTWLCCCSANCCRPGLREKSRHVSLATGELVTFQHSLSSVWGVYACYYVNYSVDG